MDGIMQYVVNINSVPQIDSPLLPIVSPYTAGLTVMLSCGLEELHDTIVVVLS